MNKNKVEVERSLLYKSYHTDESGNWLCDYVPANPENEKIIFWQSGCSPRYEMSVETARALAHLILAAVMQYDTETLIEEILQEKE